MIKQEVWNPNFFKDLVDYLKPAFSENDLKNVLNFIRDKSPTTYEKLETLIDRFEFVGHLEIVKNQARQEEFMFQGEEIKGIDWDIDALRLYLSLTCIDILASNFEPFDEWLIEKCHDFDSSKDLKSYLTGKSKEYKESFQLSSNFSRAFLNSSEPLRSKICSNVKVCKGKESYNSLERIARYLYRIRNKYTHEGRRFHAKPIMLLRFQDIGPRDEEFLEIKPGFDLVNSILLVAKDQANRVISKYAEQSNSAYAKKPHH